MVMRTYVAAAFLIAVTIGPASALDVGLGGKVGGIGVGANVGLGSKGASLGVGANVGKAAGAKAEASVGKSNGSLGASLGVSGNIGHKSGGVSVDVDTGDGVSVDVGTGGGSPDGSRASAAPGNTADRASKAAGNTAGRTGAASRNTAGRSAAGSGSAGTGAVGKTAAIAPTKSVRHSIILPRTLRPSKSGRGTFVRGTKGYPLALQTLSKAFPKAIPGTPRAVVRVCRQAIASAATPLGAVRVHAASGGPPRRQRRGAITAPIEVRIHYARQGGIEVRQARVGCRLDADGRVIAVT
jgi:hypothetical protein